MQHDDDEKLGATGQFPDGKLDPYDQGELRLGIGPVAGGLVRLEFGKPVRWFALSAEGARELAQRLNESADEAERRRPAAH